MKRFAQTSFQILALGIILSLGAVSPQVAAADRDDLYAEVVGATGINVSSRHRFGVLVGYVARDDIGVGFGYEQLFSTDSSTPDELGARASLELRWFQEPFEFSADVGLLRRFYRDSRSQMEASVGVTTAYLLALTPSMAAKVDFSFLFLDKPRVLFSGGVGARILF
jgi:hypothetical protein